MPALKSTSLREIAELTGATVKGDPDFLITGVHTIERAGPSDLTFLTSQLYQKYLADTKAGCVVLSPADADDCPTNALISDNPRRAYAQIVQALWENGDEGYVGIHASAVIAPSAKIGANVVIGPHCVIGEGVSIGDNAQLLAGVRVGRASTLGDGVVLHAGVVLYSDVHLGDNVVVHANTVIGSDGFGFEPNEKGEWMKLPQIGGVRIGARTEIGASCAIDRGAVHDTVIGEGVILDNLIQIAHNVEIGDHSAIASCTGIAGSTRIGRHCLIGGATCIKGHIEIADGVQISGMSMVTRSLRTPGQYSSGMPVREKQRWLKNINRFHQLDDIARRLKAVEKATLEQSTE